ncbi:MAG TPA: COX aromatic rich motif-containing protein [Candidatus Paceibacterota bacterium]|nr:COX aromatic rich motif-containing protein [Candidatus Paceibacterota bacterium]
MIALFMPAGPVAAQERTLIVTMVLLMLVVVVPMFIALFTIARRYRSGNPKAKHVPDGRHRGWTELWLWAVPAALVAVLGTLCWQYAHALDPYRPIASPNPPLTVQVVALEWKWLFIYPQQDIATVNYLEFPAGTPVHFELTADAPMSSFWIPRLGSQIYAMAAMETQLNLLASTTGEYVGKDTEINGAGYAGMTFTANSVSPSDFNAWVASVQASGTYSALDQNAYAALAMPSEYAPPAYYSSVQENLFDNIMMEYMEPSPTAPVPASATPASGAAMPGMSM